MKTRPAETVATVRIHMLADKQHLADVIAYDAMREGTTDAELLQDHERWHTFTDAGWQHTHAKGSA